MNLFLQYKVGRDVVRNAAVLAPAQRKYREVQGAVWTLWSRLLDFHAFCLGLRNENLQILQNGANLAQPPEVER